jgi:hypothetical protein
MSGWLTVEEAEAQIEAASDKYINEIPQDRFDNYNDNYSPPSWIWDNDFTELNSSSAYNSNGDYIGEVYSGGNGVGTDWPANYKLLGKVLDTLDSGNIFTTGGPIPGAGQGFPDNAGYTSYCDSLVLAEASKITGEKWF